MAVRESCNNVKRETVPGVNKLKVEGNNLSFITYHLSMMALRTINTTRVAR